MKVKEYFEMYKKSRAFDNRENGLMSAFCNVKTVFSKQKPHSTNTNYYLLWPLRYCQTCCIKKRQLIEKNESSETLTSLMCVQWPKIDPPIGQNFTSKPFWICTNQDTNLSLYCGRVLFYHWTTWCFLITYSPLIFNVFIKLQWTQ